MQKKTHSIFSVAVSLIILFSIAFCFSACKRNKTCKATITVTDISTGTPISGATVTMGPNKSAPQGNLAIQTQTATTDGSGSVSFTFKLPAILNAAVVAPSPPYSGATVNKLVQLEEGKSVSTTIPAY